MFSATEEGISIAAATGTAPTGVYLKPFYNPGTYTVMVTANAASFLAADTSVFPVVRIWAKGNLIGTVKLESATDCTGTNLWWKVVTLSAAPPVLINTCVSGGMNFPYVP